MFTLPEAAKFLGPAMGVVFKASGHKMLYLVGDTTWRNEVDQALAQYDPQIIVINAGYATMRAMKAPSSWVRRMSCAPLRLPRTQQSLLRTWILSITCSKAVKNQGNT
ncbi:hypothetical protein EKL30_05325 [Candidimonas sp. SYP-B2681]|uniref:hypothetical protein n=1 Tax=Candidimonas sp. SYP-B2681 TaxID=2497686 RepID=UPI000F865C20|nr:hypothetical protein [Candidimonas sp. SYP-B2681]RTZ45460.1 hypothetical protein EKL30_05325 [Candidimonas sp. SYP-B2681]